MSNHTKTPKPEHEKPKLSLQSGDRLCEIFSDNSQLVTVDGVPVEKRDPRSVYSVLESTGRSRKVSPIN